MDAVLEPFAANAFMQRALVAGLLTVVTTSLVGTWVVLRGMAFIGDALAHGVLPGIALAFLAGVDLSLGAAAAAVVMVLGVNLVSRRTGLPEDTGIGLLFVGMLAAGVTIISLRGSYSGDLTAVLFGDAIAVRPAEVVASGVAAAVALAATLVGYRPFLVLSFHRDKAAEVGFRPSLAHIAMLGLVAMAVVVSFRTVGTLLVFAFLIAPTSTAALLARRVPVMMGTAVLLGAVAVVAGLLVSYHAGTPASSTVAALAVAEFFAVLLVRDAAGAFRRAAA